MTTITVDVEAKDLTNLSLDELGELARSEAKEATAAAVSAVEHAVAAGEALLEARRRCPEGEWTSWLKTNFPLTAYRYMRLATFRDEIPEHVDSIAAADRYITGNPRLKRHGSGRTSEETEERARQCRELVAAGWKQTEVAEAMGVTDTTISRYMNPEQTRRSRRLESERAAKLHKIKAEEKLKARDNAVKKVGGDLSHVYAALRRVEQMADRAMASVEDDNSKRALESVILRLYGAEDVLVAAMNLDRQHGRGRHKDSGRKYRVRGEA